jgi:hypothetical protein
MSPLLLVELMMALVNERGLLLRSFLVIDQTWLVSGIFKTTWMAISVKYVFNLCQLQWKSLVVLITIRLLSLSKE